MTTEQVSDMVSRTTATAKQETKGCTEPANAVELQAEEEEQSG